MSVSALDEDHSWAVGYNGTIIFYNGSSWSAQSSVTTNNFNGVFALDATHIWAVGDYGTILFGRHMFLEPISPPRSVFSEPTKPGELLQGASDKNSLIPANAFGL